MDNFRVPSGILDLKRMPFQGSCKLCNSSRLEKLFIVMDVPILRCQTCGLQFTEKIPSGEEIKHLYSNDYFNSPDSIRRGYDNYLKDRKAIEKTFARRWRQTKPLLPNRGTLLEIGCAFGFLAGIGLSEGWDVYGCDYSKEAISFARREFPNGYFTVGSFDDMELKSVQFDHIVLWDVIEHLEDPFDFVKKICERLKTGGTLSIITPDSGSFLARIMKERWVEYKKPEEHYFFFSKKTLETLLNKAGLQVVKATTAGKYVSFSFVTQRLSTYWKMFKPANPFFNLLKLQNWYIYANPRDKLFLIAKRNS